MKPRPFSIKRCVEWQELAGIPQEEQEELALIYQAKGVEPEAARQMAARLIAADKQDGKYEAALDTLDSTLKLLTGLRVRSLDNLNYYPCWARSVGPRSV